MASADPSRSAQTVAGSPGSGDPAATVRPLDDESRRWVHELAATGTARDEALARLHALLLRASRAELGRRRGRHPVTGPELDDLAHQAADDALVAIVAKLPGFRGESRFTTWAYKFAVLEVSAKLGRHFWQRPGAFMDVEDWDRLPDRFGVAPEDHALRRELVDAVGRAVAEQLTAHQREVFVAIVVDAVPLDAVVARTGSNRNAIYKTMFDARRKLHAALVANGHLPSSATGRERRRALAAARAEGTQGAQGAGSAEGAEAMSGWSELDRFLSTDPRDVGCDEALRLLHVYVDLVRDDSSEQAARRYPGIAEHLRACGPCGDDFDGLLNAVKSAGRDETGRGDRR